MADEASAISRTLLRWAWIFIGGMAVCASAALMTGMSKGAGAIPLLAGSGCAISAALSILIVIVINLVRRESIIGALLALGAAMACVAIFLLPIYYGAKRGSNRPQCGINLRQIGHGIFFYGKAHDVTPARLEDLVISGLLSPECLICPESQDRPADPCKPLAEQFAKPGHCSYTYLLPSTPYSKLDSELPMAADSPANHNNEGAMVVFGDGHVEWVSTEVFQKLLATTRPVPSTRAVK